MIVLRGVRKHYGRITALEEVWLEVARGEIVAVTGPSGAGKTTLLRLVAGLERPDAGEVLLDGRLASSPRRLVPPHRRGVGLSMQHPALWPHMTVMEHLEFVAGPRPGAGARKHLEIHLNALGLSDLADRRADGLSGGEARRLSLARALAARPRILLLDEPLAHLDPALRSLVLGHVITSARKEGMTVLLVSHRQEDLREISPRVVRIEAGRLEPGSADAP